MKTLFTLLLIIPGFGFTQKIAEDKIDEFTKHKIQRTTWEETVSRFSNYFYAYTRISKIDDAVYLNLKFSIDRVTSMDKGALLMLKTDSDSIINLSNLEYKISCEGCGTVGFVGSGLPGLDVSFILSKDQFAYLKIHLVTKIRVYTTDGYMEAEIKKKGADKFIKQLQLIN